MNTSIKKRNLPDGYICNGQAGKDAIRFFAIMLITAVFLVSCSDSNETSPISPDPNGSENGDNPIEFSSDRVDPFDTVEIEGLPSNLVESDVWAEITIEGFDEQIQTIIYRENDVWLLRAPYHPLQPMEGGLAEIYITDGEQFSTKQAELFLNPLEPAPGSFGEFAQAMSKLLTGYLEQAGTSRAELEEADPAELADIRGPLMIAYGMIDMPQNENSLREIAEGTAPILNNYSIDSELLDAVFAKMKLTDLVQVSQAGIDTLAKYVDTEEIDADYRSKFKLQNGSDKIFDIKPEKLNSLMWAQEAAETLNTKRHNDILNVAGQGLAVIGLAAPVPPVKAVAGAASLGLWAWGMMIDSMTHTLPSKFLNSENDLTVTPVDFPEDSKDGSWRLKPVAESNGWSVDKAILSTLLQIVGARGVKGMNNKVVDKMVEKLGEDMTEFVITDRLESIINEVTSQPGEGILKIKPQKWTADVTKFSKMTVVEGSSVESGSQGSNEIKPAAIGVSRLRAEKQEKYFAYQALLRFKNVEVHKIVVNIDPIRSSVEPGSEVYLTANVEYAEDPSVDWSVTNGVIDDNGMNAVLYTPDEPWETPIIVTAESTTRKGLRADGEPPRTGLAQVLTDEVTLIIIPGGGCISPGESLAFNAEVNGYDGEPEILWRASSGTFTNNIYTAPGSKVNSVTISASIIGTDITESITIRVGDCKCTWNATFSGGLSGSASGNYAVFEDISTPEGTATQFTFWPEEIDNRPAFFSTALPKILPNRTGSSPQVVFFIEENGKEWASLNDEEIGVSLPTNHVELSTNNTLAGTFNGDLVYFDFSNPQQPEVVTAGFTLEYFSRKKVSSANPCE